MVGVLLLAGPVGIAPATGQPTSAPSSDTPPDTPPDTSPDTPPSTGTVRLSWPLAEPHPVLTAFRPPDSPYGPGHRGVDLGGTPGQPVYAAAAGRVVFAGHLVDRNVVSITHTGGLRTTYEPVTPTVHAGEPVTAGERIGRLDPGHQDCAETAACLHWGARRGEGHYLDPLALMSSGRVRLLPMPDT